MYEPGSLLRNRQLRLVSHDPLPDLLLDMITTRKTPLNYALMAACQWLKRHPGMKADPEVLLEFVSAWVVVAKPINETEARQCGIHAVKECAGCVKGEVIPEPELIEPNDLMD